MNTNSPAPRLSVCIITYNEEADIRACIESARWADEIIVVDSLSSDRTVEIAREAGARVIERPWPGNVEQKNFALDQASGDWILSLDADERVSPELAEEIRAVMAAPGAPAGYTMPRKTFYLGRWITHGGWYPSRQLRLTQRGRARWTGVNPHGHLYADGPVGDLAGDIHHYTYRDIADHLRTVNSYTTISAQELRLRGTARPVPRMIFNPAFRFFRMYLLRRGFLDGAPGLIVACLASYYVFLKYAKLWELRKPG